MVVIKKKTITVENEHGSSISRVVVPKNNQPSSKLSTRAQFRHRWDGDDVDHPTTVENKLVCSFSTVVGWWVVASVPDGGDLLIGGGKQVFFPLPPLKTNFRWWQGWRFDL
jgi:hypothetical protein